MRGPALIGLLLLAYLLSAVGFFLYAPKAAFTRGWSGYHTLLVPNAQDTPDVLSKLAEAGYTEVVSDHSATVSISNYSGLERVPLSRLEDRLAPMDPRRDPFVETLPELFVAGSRGEYRVYYVASEESAGVVRRKLGQALEGVEGWELVQPRPVDRWVFVLAFIGVAALCTGFSRRSRMEAAAGAVPWLGAVLTAGAGIYVASTAVYFAWVLFADTGRRYLDHRLQYGEWEEGRRELRYSLLVLGTTWALALGFVPNVSPAMLLPVLISSIGVVALTGLAVVRAVYRRRRQEHRLFVPVSMRRTPAPLSAASRYAAAAPWVALLIVAAPFVASLAPRAEIPHVPQPVFLPGARSVSFDTLEQVDAVSSVGLVDIADYVAHIAYQQGFVYGASYGLPNRGGTLSLSRYPQQDGRTVREEHVVLRYDETWLDQTIERAAATSTVGALLLNGNTPSGVVRSPEPGVYSRVTHPARYSLQALLALSPFLVLSIRVFTASRSGAPIPVLRRKRQAA